MKVPTNSKSDTDKKVSIGTKVTVSKTTGKVKANSNAAEGLRELFVDSLKEICWAEKALAKALPKMAKNATTEELVTAIEDHTEVTLQQVERLEQVFGLLGEKAVAKKCEAMAGLLKEGESILEETIPGPVRDAGIIAASQKIEHYEIATYGTLCAFAKTLGENEAGQLLMQTFAEEKEADKVLSDAACGSVNLSAYGKDSIMPSAKLSNNAPVKNGAPKN